ncbi:sarcosine oxidase subunit gamma family protein [Sinorhizobium psoraleae]|uniref:Sarcosine oxidase, subunit gamma n=1 Tax=Sinorhizobium psoraleae TaxID=520838 RepID=A0ABT4KQC4_9HYPH|nr:sarcosine oxidase subunit gamma family protein [Sinorhizobium psoraleae]MCZ4094044.1 sarcosine oxidase, subunit gamma [Sinorhizobium psoraleae]
MSDFPIALRPALGSATGPALRGVSLTAMPEGHVVQVLGRRPHAPDLSGVLEKAAGPAPRTVRAAGPGQWFIVGDAPLSRDEFAALSAALQPHATAVDQSHGRIRIRVEGTMVKRMLAKGTAVDLDPGAFPVGTSAMTLLGHVSVHLTRIEIAAFEIMVLRGFAESLWEDLVRMSAEFA